MRHYLIAQRYAKALSGSIEDASELEPTLEWLGGMADLIAENADLRTALTNPAIKARTRQAVLEEILEKSAAGPVAANLLREVLRRGRITILGDIAGVFGELVDQRLNRVTATVTSARPLSATDEERVAEGLKQYSGKTVRTKTNVNPEIIGGVVVRIGGAVIDGSLRARLHQIRSSLLSEENGTS